MQALLARNATAVVARTHRLRLQSPVNTRLMSLVPPRAASGLGSPTWQARMLFDGECPLCLKEVNFLRSKDAGIGNIDFTDISSPSYSPDDNLGITYEQAMARIHVITSSGKIVTDVAAFRTLYEAVGLGWVYAITANPTVEKMANFVYDIWAKYRLQITGREALDLITSKRRQAEAGDGTLPGSACGGDEDAACEIPLRTPPAKSSAGSQA